MRRSRKVARVMTASGLVTGGAVAAVVGPATAAMAYVPSEAFYNRGTGMCLTADSGTPHDWDPVVQAQCRSGNFYQQWYQKFVTSVCTSIVRTNCSGVYQLKAPAQSYDCLVADSHEPYADGAVYQWDCNAGNASQQWAKEYGPRGMMFKNQATGMCIRANPYSGYLGGAIVQFPCNSQDLNQQWAGASPRL